MNYSINNNNNNNNNAKIYKPKVELKENKLLLKEYNPEIQKLFFEKVNRDLISEKMNPIDYKDYVAKIVHFNSHLYTPIFSNFLLANPYGVHLSTEKWAFDLRNLKFPGLEQDITSNSFNKEFFAFGNTRLEEAPMIFIGDSNHANKILTKKMIELLVTLVKDNDLVMLEGLSQGVEIEASFKDKKFIIKGWEDREVYKQLLEDLKNGRLKNEVLVDARNKILTNFINESASKYKKRIIVLCGENHISKDVVNNLNDQNYISLFTRYTIFDNKKELIKIAKKYHLEGADKENNHLNIMKSLGVSFSNYNLNGDGEIEDLKEQLKNPRIIKNLEEELENNPQLIEDFVNNNPELRKKLEQSMKKDKNI